MVLPGEAVTLLQDNIRQLVTEQKGGLLSFGILGRALVLLQCRGGHYGSPEPGL